MRIEHLAIWTKELDTMVDFYVHYFMGEKSNRYHNPKKQFESYFISFDNGARLELMRMGGVPESGDDIYQQRIGLIHFAISVGSKEAVDELTNKIREDGFEVIGEPRWTGDGYYESVVLDPEQNRIELTI